MMNFFIIVSEKDPAGLNIHSNLIENYPFERNGRHYRYRNIQIARVEEESFLCENIDQELEADMFIFATKHSSKKGVHSLSIHAPGNWGKAEMGGKDRTLCIAPASYIKEGLKAIYGFAKNTHFEITVEQTHHGPHIDKPCLFIEIGSNLEQWQDKAAGRIIAKSIMRMLKAEPSYKSTVLLGGGHYNHEANKILLNSDYAVGHICAKHSLADLDEGMLRQAIDNTMEKVELILIDWKGLGAHKQKVLDILDKVGIRYERSKNFLKERA